MTQSLIVLTAAAMAAVLAAISGCASTPAVAQHYSLVPVRSNGQDLAGMDSHTILESRQPGGIVSVRAEENFAEFGAGFIVAVRNMSGAPQEFGPRNIEATVNGSKLQVMAADELQKKIEGEARGYLRATSRTGSVDIEAATPDVSREYRFNNFGGHPAGTQSLAYGDDNGSNYRQDRLNRDLEAKTIAGVATSLQLSQQIISQRALRPATVTPDQMVGGVVVVQPPKTGGNVDLVVTFNGQKHRFTFAATPTA